MEGFNSAPDAAVFTDPVCAREVDAWLLRAPDADVARFDRVFGELRSGETQHAPPRTTSKPTMARPTMPGGWMYTSTKAAAVRSGTGTSSLLGVATAAAVRPCTSISDAGGTQELFDATVTGWANGPATAARPGSAGAAARARPISAPQTSGSKNTATVSTFMRSMGPGATGAVRDPEPPVASLVHFNREIASLVNAHKGSPALAASEARVAAKAERMRGEARNPNQTDYQATFGARAEYPELYERAIALLKSEPVPNYTHISEWGDTLRKANDPEWRKKFMQSTYNAGNDDAVDPSTVKAVEAAKEKAFFAWMVKQKTYYGDLMKKLPQEDLEALAGGASLEKKREILDCLRQMYAVAQPNAMKSVSHTDFKLMARVEDEALTAMMMEMVRLKTMGHPPPVIRAEDMPKPGGPVPDFLKYGLTLKDLEERESAKLDATRAAATAKAALAAAAAAAPPAQQHGARPGSAAPAVATIAFGDGARARSAGAALDAARATGLFAAGPVKRSAGAASRPLSAQPAPGSGHASVRPLSALVAAQTASMVARPGSAARPAAPKPRRKVTIETHTSKVPLSWPGCSSTLTTAYKDAFGGASADGEPRPASSKQYQAIRIPETTCPIGAVDFNTCRLAPERAAYPVPASYTTRLAFPQPSDDKTTYRSDFFRRGDADTVRTQADMAWQAGLSKAAALRTGVPFGDKGFSAMASKDWRSDYQANLVGHTVDIKTDRLRAAALKASLGGPTATGGALTRDHPKPKGAEAPAA
ncbi:hypothetical protein FOA52_013824 [Chlamydomonas sp. UWO 241]|nr:hypothetical protein FOA52_013824 [Chlamydomonas sp. UWO 241]